MQREIYYTIRSLPPEERLRNYDRFLRRDSRRIAALNFKLHCVPLALWKIEDASISPEQMCVGISSITSFSNASLFIWRWKFFLFFFLNLRSTHFNARVRVRSSDTRLATRPEIRIAITSFMRKTPGKLRPIFEKRYQDDRRVKFEVFKTNVWNFVEKNKKLVLFLPRDSHRDVF